MVACNWRMNILQVVPIVVVYNIIMRFLNGPYINQMYPWLEFSLSTITFNRWFLKYIGQSNGPLSNVFSHTYTINHALIKSWQSVFDLLSLVRVKTGKVIGVISLYVIVALIECTCTHPRFEHDLWYLVSDIPHWGGLAIFEEKRLEFCFKNYGVPFILWPVCLRFRLWLCSIYSVFGVCNVRTCGVAR